jgi:hypothetical protein
MPDEDEYAGSSPGHVFGFTPEDADRHGSQLQANILQHMQQGLIQSAPRQTGKSRGAGATYGQRQPDPLNRPLPAPLHPGYIPNGAILRFRTYGQFLYAAVYVRHQDKPPAWYITGSGKWFGTNELSDEQMSEVLMRPSTSHIRTMDDPIPIIGRWT